MPIRSKLTVRDGDDAGGSKHRGRETGGAGRPQPGARPQPSEEERATRKARVAAAKDALARSTGLRGDHVAPARAALKAYLRGLNERRQPDDDQFAALVEGPFRVPPKKRERR